MTYKRHCQGGNQQKLSHFTPRNTAHAGQLKREFHSAAAHSFTQNIAFRSQTLTRALFFKPLTEQNSRPFDTSSSAKALAYNLARQVRR